jgi:hypothetical protein
MPKYLDNEIRAAGRRNHRRKNNSRRMGDEVLHSIMRRQLIEVSKEDFAVISELAESITTTAITNYYWIN